MPNAAAGRMLFLLGALVFAHSVAVADTYMARPSDYLALLRKLRAGDTLILAPGVYQNGLPVHGMVGSSHKPIVIRGPQSQPLARFVARAGANTVSIADSGYVEIINIEVDGHGIGSPGVVAEGWSKFAHHITLDNLYIHGHDADQQITGISTRCPAWGWVIKNNVIAGAGTGIYLGHSDGSAPFVAGLIEHNLILDSIGYNLQIKHQNERPRIAGMPEEKSVTIIRHNVFAKSANSSSGALARPNLLVGHWPPSGAGAQDTYAIYGNFFFQNPSEALFQGEGNFAFYSNVLVNTYGDAINIQRHNAVPRRIDVFHNTVLAAKAGIRVSGGDAAYPQRVMANAVFASAPIVGGDQHANKTGLLAEAAEHLAEPFAPPGVLDLSPKPGKLTSVPVTILPQALLPDVNQDFDGKPYLDPIAGAYSGNSISRRLTIGIKP